MPHRRFDDLRVLALHSSASSPRQWQRLADRLAPGCVVLAPALAGYLGSERWTRRPGWSFDAEAEAFDPLLDERPLHLVGHSFGAAVALQIALRRPDRVRSLALYEPVRFALLTQAPAAWPQVVEISALAAAVAERVGAGLDEAAAEGFVDYWSGAGAWAALPAARRAAVALRMPKVADEFAAAFSDALAPAELRRLAMPVLLLGGERSPAPVQELLRRLAAVLPDAERRLIPEAGHMGPLTHADAVNALLDHFLQPRPGRLAA